MGYRPQVKSARSGRGHQKTQHEKKKNRKLKHRLIARDTMEETYEVTVKEIVDKTFNSLRGLGNQKFALSPFSQYYDDWLLNLGKVISFFESNPMTKVDKEFIEERSRIMKSIEITLNQKELEEESLKEKTNARSEKNHLLADMDADYASETRNLGQRRKTEIENLTLTIKDLEKQLEETSNMKTSLFGGFSKKNKMNKQVEITDKLSMTKKRIETAIQNFKIEQEKLHDEYEKKKTATVAEIMLLEKEIEKYEIDRSQPHRQMACESLVEAINMLLKRKTQTSQS